MSAVKIHNILLNLELLQYAPFFREISSSVTEEDVQKTLDDLGEKEAPKDAIHLGELSPSEAMLYVRISMLHKNNKEVEENLPQVIYGMKTLGRLWYRSLSDEDKDKVDPWLSAQKDLNVIGPLLNRMLEKRFKKDLLGITKSGQTRAKEFILEVYKDFTVMALPLCSKCFVRHD